MKTKKKKNFNAMKYFVILFFLFVTTYLFGQSDTITLQTGLTFKAHNYNQDERTSLNLTPDQSIKFKQSFDLIFKMKHISEEQTYGYVFRLIINDTISLDMNANHNGSKINFILGSKSNVLLNSEFQEQIKIDKWLDIKISITKDSLQFCINEDSKKIENPLKEINNIQIIFGKNNLPLFLTTDVAPISIKDISIYSNNKNILFWDLGKHRNNEVYDTIKNKKATVTNGIWEIDKHLKWQLFYTYKINSKNPQVVYDKDNGRFLVAFDSKILEIDLIKQTKILINVAEGNPFIGVGTYLFYNGQTNCLISYNSEFQSFSTYDFTLNKWSNTDIREQSKYQHHSSFFDKKRQKLITFGGYGLHTYNSLIKNLDFNTGEWSQEDISDIITPRYLSAMGKLDDDNLLIMGGYGSKTGKQEESPTNHYDIYKYNIETDSCSKMFDFLNDTNENYTFSNSLVVDKNNVYALAYNNNKFNTSIKLFNLDLESKNISIATDSIPYHFWDLYSFCNLVYCEQTNALYAILIQKAENEDNNSTIEIYSISYPVLKKEDVLQKENNRSSNIWIVYTIITLLFIGFTVFILYKKVSKRKSIKESLLDKEKIDITDFSIIEDIQNVDLEYIESTNSLSVITERENSLNEKIDKSAIYLLGGFQVFSNNGKDLTSAFTPIIKQLFVSILLSTIKNGRGITSEYLTELFWFDLENKNALNNRRVNISKLRQILKEIGDINVLNNNNYWSIEFGKSIYCDYSLITNQLNDVRDTKIYDPKSIYLITKLASKGILLPEIQTEWIDYFKAEYSNLLIDVLFKATKAPLVCNDLNFLIRIANVILEHDNIDENGIQIKCLCLYKLGQKGLSKQIYDKFSLDYKRMLDADPDLKYENIIAFS